MTAIKITEKMFSGGSTKMLAETLRGLAIDNARHAFNDVDKNAVRLKSNYTTLPGFTLNKLPSVTTADKKGMPQRAFWDWVGDANMQMQTVAKAVNVVAGRLGIDPINAMPGDTELTEVMMHLTEDDPVEHEQNHAGALARVRDGQTALASHMHAIRLALGLAGLKGTPGGSHKCTTVYSGFEDTFKNMANPVDPMKVAEFVETWNQNMVYLVHEWNLLMGENAPGFYVETRCEFDPHMIVLPQVICGSPMAGSSGMFEAAEAISALDDLIIVMSAIEMWIDGEAERFGFPYTITFPGGQGKAVSIAGIVTEDQEDGYITPADSKRIIDVALELRRATKDAAAVLNGVLGMNMLPMISVIDPEDDVIDPDGTLHTKQCRALLAGLTAGIATLAVNTADLSNSQKVGLTLEPGLHVIAG